VIKHYDEMGFNMNNDVPTNWQWENLYDNIDDAKVILTVRDDEEKWLKSWQTFCDVQTNKHGLWSKFFLPILMHTGQLGQMQLRFDNLVLKWLCGIIGFPQEEWSVWKMHLEYAGKMDPELLKAKYLSHNANVIKKVPKERLLIWNLKDGWEPICKFLNVPIPDEPIPIVNKTTDKMFFDNLFQDKIGKHLPWKAWVHRPPGPRRSAWNGRWNPDERSTWE